MSDTQFKNLIKLKRDKLRHTDSASHLILPSIDSIFENKDLVKKINQMKASLLSFKQLKKDHTNVAVR